MARVLRRLDGSTVGLPEGEHENDSPPAVAAVGDPDGEQLRQCDVVTLPEALVGAALGADLGVELANSSMAYWIRSCR